MGEAGCFRIKLLQDIEGPHHAVEDAPADFIAVQALCLGREAGVLPALFFKIIIIEVDAGILTRFNRFKQREVPAKHCDMGERHHAALLGNGERPGPELRQFVLRDGGSAVCVDKGSHSISPPLRNVC